jgi:hypothetical protein
MAGLILVILCKFPAMPRDTVSFNTKMLSPDTFSYFKGFVMAQDEVPVKLHRDASESSHIPTNINPEQRIIQSQNNRNDQLRVSIFVPHRLQPKDHSPLPLNEMHNEWIMGVIFLCFLLAGFVRIFHFPRLSQIFRAFMKASFMNQLMRDGNLLNERITPPLILLHLFSVSLFVYQAIYLLVGIPFPAYTIPTTFVLIFSAVSGFYGVRIILIKIIGWVFNTKEQSNVYIINSMIFNEVWGLILLPLSLMMYYTAPGIAVFIAWFALFLFVSVIIYMLIRGFLIGLTVRNFSWLYLFLYLCTVEFLPVLVLGKLAVDRFF